MDLGSEPIGSEQKLAPVQTIGSSHCWDARYEGGAH